VGITGASAATGEITGAGAATGDGTETLPFSDVEELTAALHDRAQREDPA
jgi:hypothetical protein